MNKKAILISIFFSLTTRLQSISVVYDLRLAQTTRHFIIEEDTQWPYTAAINHFNQFRKTRDGVREETQGFLGHFIYSTDSFYTRIDGAAGHVRDKKDGMRSSRTQTDDILFLSGFGWRIHERAKITLSALVGLPTHNDLSLEGIQFGTGHVGLGVQIDGSLAYHYTQSKKNFFVSAARFVGFLPRDVNLFHDNKKKHFEIRGGNLVDLMVGHYTRWKNQRFEVEYNPFFAFGARTQPRFDEKVMKRANFIRSSFHIAYQYGFTFDEFASAVAIRLSYAFDHKPKTLGLKHSLIVWLLWGISF